MNYEQMYRDCRRELTRKEQELTDALQREHTALERATKAESTVAQVKHFVGTIYPQYVIQGGGSGASSSVECHCPAPEPRCRTCGQKL